MTGDARASRREFEGLLEPLLDPLYGTALRLARSRPDAEDLVQESVMKAWRSFDRFEKGTNFKAWVFKILMNTFVSSRRSAARAPRPAQLVEEVPAPTPARDASPEEWSRLYPALVDDDVKNALDALPEEFREPLLLSSLGELSYKEMASALEVPVGTIMSRLFRGRERLRALLKDYALGRGIRVATQEGR